MLQRRLIAALLGAGSFIAGCASPARKAASAPPPPIVTPVEMTVWQRTTTVVPGSQGSLELTIDDVTAGQVMASLSRRGEVVRGPVSLSEGASSPFTLDGHAYELRLTELDNALLGDDAATFIIDAAEGDASADAALRETEKIELLIQSVAELENAVFIRNEREHTVEEAVDHMRMKWEAAWERMTTAREFIEGAASRSSITGQPYQIRFADGTTITSREYLYQQLERIESNASENDAR